MALNFPDSPSDGDTFQGLQYNSSKGVWNSTATTPAGGVTSYANLAAFPSSGNTAGDYGFATDTKALYVCGHDLDVLEQPQVAGRTWPAVPSRRIVVLPLSSRP